MEGIEKPEIEMVPNESNNQNATGRANGANTLASKMLILFLHV